MLPSTGPTSINNDDGIEEGLSVTSVGSNSRKGSRVYTSKS